MKIQNEAKTKLRNAIENKFREKQTGCFVTFKAFLNKKDSNKLQNVLH